MNAPLKLSRCSHNPTKPRRISFRIPRKTIPGTDSASLAESPSWKPAYMTMHINKKMCTHYSIQSHKAKSTQRARSPDRWLSMARMSSECVWSGRHAGQTARCRDPRRHTRWPIAGRRLVRRHTWSREFRNRNAYRMQMLFDCRLEMYVCTWRQWMYGECAISIQNIRTLTAWMLLVNELMLHTISSTAWSVASCCSKHACKMFSRHSAWPCWQSISHWPLVVFRLCCARRAQFRAVVATNKSNCESDDIDNRKLIGIGHLRWLCHTAPVSDRFAPWRNAKSVASVAENAYCPSTVPHSRRSLRCAVQELVVRSEPATASSVLPLCHRRRPTIIDGQWRRPIWAKMWIDGSFCSSVVVRCEFRVRLARVTRTPAQTHEMIMIEALTFVTRMKFVVISQLNWQTRDRHNCMNSTQIVLYEVVELNKKYIVGLYMPENVVKTWLILEWTFINNSRQLLHVNVNVDWVHGIHEESRILSCICYYFKRSFVENILLCWNVCMDYHFHECTFISSFSG